MLHVTFKGTESEYTVGSGVPVLANGPGDISLLKPGVAVFVIALKREQRHSGTARLDHDHPLTSTKRKTPQPDNTCLGHPRADHPQRYDRDRAIGMKIIRSK